MIPHRETVSQRLGTDGEKVLGEEEAEAAPPLSQVDAEQAALQDRRKVHQLPHGIHQLRIDFCIEISIYLL